MGAVAVTEQAIINEAHYRGLQVTNRKEVDSGSTQAAGAYVAYPKKGLHQWIGSMDLNSLYPSVIRALNMAPETIVGQLRQDYTDARILEDTTLKKMSFANSWEGRFGSEEYEMVMQKRNDVSITVDWEDGRSEVLSGAQIYKLVFESYMPWMLSANGTIFTTEYEGVIPGLLKRWYTERQELQATKKQWSKLESGIKLPKELADELAQYTAN
jgi:DNA polymerase elongation subunit (family B)